MSLPVEYVQVQRDLSAILELAADAALLTQAVHNANATVDGHSLPGGNAMIALAPVGDLARWERRVEEAEAAWARVNAEAGATVVVESLGAVVVADRAARPEVGVDEDDSWEPPLQTLRFWTDHYRRVLGQDWDHIPTLFTEASFLKNQDVAMWVATHEPNWARYVDDIKLARTRLENLLYAGERAERGVPCLYDECRGVRLVRKIVPARGPNGEKTWKHSNWHCPSCKRTWNEDTYWSNVLAANERAQREEIDGDAWCSVQYAARAVGRSVKTIRTWIDRGEVPTACIIVGRRIKFVRLADVEARDEEARKRATRRRNRTTSV